LRNCNMTASNRANPRAEILALLTTGGDDRIRLDDAGCNRYFATAAPFDGLAYGSSTISSISADALAHLATDWHPRLADGLAPDDYAAALAGLRKRISGHFGDGSAAVVFAPSGTDLEFIGLAAIPAGAGPACSILLGRDEVGSGCIQSAAGRHFADRTATGVAVSVGTPIDARHAANRLADLPIREADGSSRSSAVIRAGIEALADTALAQGEHPVIHIVHGSKTGLTLPSLADCAALADRYGASATLVVDACQLRITPEAVRAYLALGAIVLGTGSKFAGGPPFSGFALVPAKIMRRAAPLSPGFAQLARRAEWPTGWPGRDILPHSANAGLLLRLAGALFEIDRFLALSPTRVAEILSDFQAAVQRHSAASGLALFQTQPRATPCLAASLATLDFSPLRPGLDFDAAVALHRALALGSSSTPAAAFRIGQPVRARRLDDGRFAATLRLSLAMPMVVEHAALTLAASRARFDAELGLICTTIAGLAGQKASLQNAA
jgi:hypothetical protein